jgi:hypothetical protein
MALPQIGYPTYELELPSTGKSLKYRPFTVKEEKVLLLALESEPSSGDDKSDWEKEVKTAVKTLIKNCLLTRTKVEDLPSFDLEYIFLKIRSVSISDEIKINVTCKDDQTTVVPVKVNIEEVKVVKPDGHSNKIMMTDTTGIVMKYPSLDRFVESEFIGKNIREDEILEFIACHIDNIFDEEEIYDSSSTSKKELIDWVESLTTQQFEKIQKFYVTMPKLQYEFTVKNPNTGVESEYTIEGMSSFFA